MKMSFTRTEIIEMTATDLAASQKEFPAGIEKPPWVDRMSPIIRDLHALASRDEPELAPIEELERRVSAFLAEDKSYKGMIPYLYMVDH